MGKAAEIVFLYGPHSSEKDHTMMSGGTLIEDKRISSRELLSLHQYMLPVDSSVTEDFHQGMHTLEHMFAYSRETGSLRVQMTRTTRRAQSGKVILDVSPFKIDEEHYAFRVTSVLPLSPQSLARAYKESLTIGADYIEQGGLPPFATPKQCGQYDFHSPQAALEIIKRTQAALDRGEARVTEVSLSEQEAASIIVADLRLIRPKAVGADNQRMLRPETSHLISQVLEHFAYRGMPYGEYGQIKFGTFGCMTGDYAMVLDRPLAQVHVAIARTLLMLSEFAESDDEEMRALGLDAKFCLTHIRDASPEVFNQAIEEGPIRIDEGETAGAIYLRRNLI